MPVIADYELIREIGHGSYGDVWLARGLTGVYRAIKIVWRDRFPDAEPFEREFKGLKKFMAASLPEAGQLALLHVGQNERAGFFYYVMELADDVATGREVNPAKYAPLTLKELRAQRGRLPAEECVQIAVELTRALAGLHSHGLVHRDIKPSNVIMVGGGPKLADIGLVASTADALTYVGTSGFVPPEGPGKPAADVFALGRLLYELATGLDRDEFPRLPPELNQVPDRQVLFALNEIILRACEPNLADRYRDATTMLADLTALQAGHSLRRRRSRRYVLGFGLGLAAAAAVALIGWWKLSSGPSADAAAATPIEPADAKSIAVLPFENLSSEADSRFFADGINEELRAALGKISALKVIGRASVLPFADPKQRNLRRIADELGVGTVVEGSVSRSGNRVRIAVQVVDAHTSRQRWAETYEHELVGGFAVQAAIAGEVASMLRATLTPGERALIARRLTDNARAYELYIAAQLRRSELDGSPGLVALDEWERVVRTLEEAITADPGFAQALALLSRVHAGIYFYSSLDSSPARRERARLALEAAVRLAPDAPETRFAQGRFAYACERSFEEAFRHYEAAARGLPNDPELLLQRGVVARRLGRNAEAATIIGRALEINPFDLSLAFVQVQTLRMLGRYAEAVAVTDRLSGTAPLHSGIAEEAAPARFEVDGNLERFKAALSAAEPSSRDSHGLERDLRVAVLTGDLELAERLVNDPRFPETSSFDGVIPNPPALLRSGVARLQGRREAAAAYAAEAIQFYDSKTWTALQQPFVRVKIMQAMANAGNEAETRRLAGEVRSRMTGKDQLNDRNILRSLWRVYLLAGARDDAVECLRALVATGDRYVGPRQQRLDPLWRLMEGDPRFEALMPLPAPPAAETPRPAIAPARPLDSAAVPALANPKSLVVLPLENLSPDPENAFFTDGMHSEIIATLSRLPDLKVMSRATAQVFKGVATPLAEIGQKLGVANILSGSVRREGRSVRVQLELRRASDEAVLWQKTFNRELQPGFALQDEIGADVARILQARGDAGWYSGAKFMTKNPEAYDLFLKARELPFLRGPSLETFLEECRLAEEALRLDPEFVSAASLLSSAYSYASVNEPDATKRKEHAAKAKRWAERAAELVPGGAGDGALAVYYGMVERDAVRSLAFAENEVRALPNDANGHNRVGAILAEFGRFSEAIAAYERALTLDPLNVRVLYNRVFSFAALRRLPEFEAAVARSLEFGGKNVDRNEYAEFRYRLTGKLPETFEPLGGPRPGPPLMLWYARRFDEVIAVADAALARLEQLPPERRFNFFRLKGAACRGLGRSDLLATTAREMLAYAETQVPAGGGDRSDYDRLRMWALAFADQRDAALIAGRRYVEATSGPGRVSERWEREHELAQIYAWFGRKKECVEILTKLIRLPTLITVPYLKLAPDWDNVRDDPGFQALLADPRNSEPL